MNTNNSDEIKLKISATNQSGMVAALHLIANKFDVKVKDSLVSRVSRDRSRVVVIFEGTLNASQNEFTEAIESHSRVYSINEIEVKPNLQIYSHDNIEPDLAKTKDETVDFETIVNEIEETESSADEDIDFETIVNEVEALEAETETETQTEIETNDSEDEALDLAHNDNSDEEAQSDSPDELVTENDKNNPSPTPKEIAYKFEADDAITDEALETIEEMMEELIGPVASLFVSTAVIEASTIGELFLLLSEELDGYVKSNFLALVKGLDESQADIH